MNFQHSNLYILFCSLTDAELKELDKAIHSPFFNYREEEIKLFDYLYKIHKGRIKTIDSTTAVKHVFTAGKGNLAKLRHVMSYLTAIINRYLAIHEMEENGEIMNLLLVRSLRKRNVDKLFLQGYEKAKLYLDNEVPASPDLYYWQLQLHAEFYNFSIINKRAPTEDLEIFTSRLNAFYVVQRLKQACNILSYKNVFKLSYQPASLNDAITMIHEKNMLADPLVKLLYNNYMCLVEPENETHFAKLKEALLNTSSGINLQELRDVFTLAINYCIKRLNTGGQNYYEHAFDIYNAGLTLKVFEERGILSPFTYKNISAIAIGLKKYTWAKQFIDNYSNKLDASVKEGFYAYCLARYYFAKADYNRVTDLLQEVEIKEQFTDLDARVLLIKTYYELDENGLMDYSIGNLKQQLKRKKIQTYHETVYRNFTLMASRLLQLHRYDKKARAAFKQKLLTTTALAEREWLLSKV